MTRLLTYIFALSLLVGCGTTTAFDASLFTESLYTPTHASGFEIRGCREGNASLIVVKNPWQGADGVEKMLLIDRDGEFNTSGSDIQRIGHNAERIICMSSSYVAMLSAIGKQKTIAGVSGIGFISDEYVVANSDRIGDVGYDNNINYELILALNPDIPHFAFWSYNNAFGVVDADGHTIYDCTRNAVVESSADNSTAERQVREGKAFVQSIHQDIRKR